MYYEVNTMSHLLKSETKVIFMNPIRRANHKLVRMVDSHVKSEYGFIISLDEIDPSRVMTEFSNEPGTYYQK